MIKRLASETIFFPIIFPHVRGRHLQTTNHLWGINFEGWRERTKWQARSSKAIMIKGEPNENMVIVKHEFEVPQLGFVTLQ